MMSGAMGNDRFIRKQIFFLLGLFFSCSNLGAMCPQTVGVITPGEGIWQITSRIGAATNVIESQICALDLVNNECSFTFGQIDIGNGGIYTISVPGTYCMTENVTFTFGSAITINANNVTLDLQGHYIDGGTNPAEVSAIQLASAAGSSLNNTIIQNGTIQNVGGAPFRYGIRQGADFTLINIVIRDMDFYNIESPTTGIGFAFRVDSGKGLLIENCRSLNGGAFFVFSNVGGSAVVRNVLAEQYVQGFAQIAVVGLAPAPWESVVIEDCILTTSAAIGLTANTYINVATATNVVVRNCVIYGGTFTSSFSFQNVVNLVVSDCIAQNGLAGFTVSSQNSFSIFFERCVAQHNIQNGFSLGGAVNRSFQIVDCVANNNGGNGFSVLPTASIGDTVFKGCYASQNGVCGFLLSNASGGAILNSAFEACVAQGNGGDGFNLDNLSGNPFANASFNDCVSQGNIGGGSGGSATYRGDGFGVNSSVFVGRPAGSTINNVVFNNCVAQHNANDGFDFGATATSGRIDTISCQYCVAQQNTLHGMNFSSTSTNCEVYMSLVTNNGGNGINNLNPIFGPSSANRFISNRSFKNVGVDYFQINDGVNGQPFFSSSSEASIQGASAWASLAT